MITLCLEILSTPTVSISSFYTHPSTYSIEIALVAVLMLTNLMVVFFFIELFSSNSTIHYHHHHSLKTVSSIHVQYTTLCVTAGSSQSPFLFYLLYKVSKSWSASKSAQDFFSFISAHSPYVSLTTTLPYNTPIC